MNKTLIILLLISSKLFAQGELDVWNFSGAIPDTLLASYNFDGDFTDETSNYDGTGFNNPSFVLGESGQAGDSAVSFNSSSSQYVSTSLALNGRSTVSLSAWFKRDAGDRIFVSAPGSVSDRFKFGITTNGDAFVLDGTNSGLISTGTKYDNTFFHMTALYDGNKIGDSLRLMIYINDTLQDLTFNGTIPSTLSHTGNIEFGRDQGVSIIYNDGEIDKVRIFSNIISREKITELYNE